MNLNLIKFVSGNTNSTDRLQDINLHTTPAATLLVLPHVGRSSQDILQKGQEAGQIVRGRNVRGQIVRGQARVLGRRCDRQA